MEGINSTIPNDERVSLSFVRYFNLQLSLIEDQTEGEGNKQN